MTPIVVGLDGGGSKTRVLVADEHGTQLGSADGPGSAVRPGEVEHSADVIAATVLRCLIIPDTELKPFLLKQPTVMYRMLQIEARRLRAANAWDA